MMLPRLLTAPATEPVTKAEAMAHSRIDTDAKDGVIDSLMVAARRRVESETGLALITQTWVGTLDAWPGTPAADLYSLSSFVEGPISLATGSSDPIEIPKRPFQSVTSIKTLDEYGAEATVSSSLYFTALEGEPARGVVMLKIGQTWPTTVLAPRAGIRITFAAGFGDGPDDVPDDLRAAILMLASHWYENREPVVMGALGKLPHHVDEILASWRNLRLG